MTAPPAPPRPRRRRFPLALKMFLTLCANVLVVGAVAFWLLRSHFGLDAGLLLTRDARARLQGLSEAMLDEMADLPQAKWSDVLARMEASHGMDFALFDGGGRQIAGDPLEPPPRLRDRLAGAPGRRQGPPLGVRRPGAERLPGERPQRPEGSPFLPGPDFGPEDDVFPENAGNQPRPQRPQANRPRPQDFPKEAFVTDDPRHYWVVVRLVSPDRLRMPGPAILVGRTSTLGGSGLLFDPAPWLWAAAGTLVFSLLLWLPLVRSLTRSLARMTEATDAISRGRFDSRVSDTRSDEIGRLGEAINRMTERLDGFVTGQKRFLGDVAHELCSPLARMEMACGILERKAPAELQERLADVREEVREMSTLVDELLSFSKASLQAPSSVPAEDVVLAELVATVVARESQGADVRVDVPPDLTARVAPALVQRALANLVRNAVRYAAPAGPIRISATREGARISLTVADEGPGVPPEALPQLFDPFFRVDPSRTRATGGVGLGLAIVKTCLEATGATVSAGLRQPSGLEVRVSLPAE